MKTIPKVNIEEVILNTINWNPRTESAQENIIYIDIGSIDKDEKKIIQCNKFKGSEAPSRARQLVKAGDILVSTVRPNLNTVAQIPSDLDGATASTGFCLLRANPTLLNNQYLLHWIRTNTFINQMVLQSTGANYPAVTDSIIKKSQIPLPPLEEQKHIAAILDKADELRHKRRQAIQRLDDLLQSIFLDMFGDPLHNQKEWLIKPVEEIFETQLGKMRSERNITGKYLHPYLRNVNVNWDRLNLSDIKKMDFKPNEIEKYRLQKGDILICEGGEVGRTAIFNGEIENCGYQNALHRLRIINPVITPEYFVQFMRLASHFGLIQKLSSQVTISHFTAEKLKKFQVMLPPITLQKKYTTYSKQIKACENLLNYNQLKFTNLFHSLQQRAFRGDLSGAQTDLDQLTELTPHP